MILPRLNIIYIFGYLLFLRIAYPVLPACGEAERGRFLFFSPVGPRFHLAENFASRHIEIG